MHNHRAYAMNVCYRQSSARIACGWWSPTEILAMYSTDAGRKENGTREGPEQRDRRKVESMVLWLRSMKGNTITYSTAPKDTFVHDVQYITTAS